MPRLQSAGKGDNDYFVNKGRIEFAGNPQRSQCVRKDPGRIITLASGVITPGPSECARGLSTLKVQGF